MQMQNIYPQTELTMREIEDLFFRQTKLLSQRNAGRR
jgi:hypothetical protein